MERDDASLKLSEPQYNYQGVLDWFLTEQYTEFMDNVIYRAIERVLLQDDIKFLILMKFLEQVSQCEKSASSSINIEAYFKQNKINVDNELLQKYKCKILNLHNVSLISKMAHLGSGRDEIGTFANKAYEYFCDHYFLQEVLKFLKKQKAIEVDSNQYQAQELFAKLINFSNEQIQPIVLKENQTCFYAILVHCLAQAMYAYKAIKQSVEQYKNHDNETTPNEIAVSPTTPRFSSVSPRQKSREVLSTSLFIKHYKTNFVTFAADPNNEYSIFVDSFMSGMHTIAKCCELIARLFLEKNKQLNNSDKKLQVNVQASLELFSAIVTEWKILQLKFVVNSESSYTPRFA